MYWAWCSHGQVAGLFNMHGLHLFWSSHIKGSVSQAYLHICEEIHFPAGQEIWEGLRIFSSMLLNTTNFYFTCSCQTQFHMKHHWDNIIFSVLHSLFGQDPAKNMEKGGKEESLKASELVHWRTLTQSPSVPGKALNLRQNTLLPHSPSHPPTFLWWWWWWRWWWWWWWWWW